MLSTTSPTLPPFLQLSYVFPPLQCLQKMEAIHSSRTLIHNTVQKPKRRPSADILDHYYFVVFVFVVVVVVTALLRGCL